MGKKIKQISIKYDSTYSLFNIENYDDELIITNGSVICKRNFHYLEEEIMWKYSYSDGCFSEKFEQICNAVSNRGEQKMASLDWGIAIINIVYDDDTYQQDTYDSSLVENGCDELVKELLSVIPQGFFIPKFLR